MTSEVSAVVGVDLSLTSTGVALVHPDGSVETGLITTKMASPETLLTRAERANTVREEFVEYMYKTLPARGVVVVEGPAPNAKFGKPWDRAGLWWMIVNWCVGSGIPIVEVPPTSRCKYLCGKGNQGKDVVLASAIKRYPEIDIVNNNVADAVGLAMMGRRAIGVPYEDSLPQTHLDAMKGVRWEAFEERIVRT